MIIFIHLNHKTGNVFYVLVRFYHKISLGAVAYQKTQSKRLSEPKNIEALISKSKSHLSKSLAHLYKSKDPNRTLDMVRRSEPNNEFKNNRSFTLNRDDMSSTSLHHSPDRLIVNDRYGAQNAYKHADYIDKSPQTEKKNSVHQNYFSKIKNDYRSRADNLLSNSYVK